jgi:two-component system, chemotaxis family, chemotaxis protein CheY
LRWETDPIARMKNRILIADDNDLVRGVLRDLLGAVENWEILEAANGKEALLMAQEIKPSVIILDLAMPLMDGLSAAREISKVLPEIPVLMYTLHSTPQLELEASKVGVRRIIAKPESGELISAVREALKQKSDGLSTLEPVPPAAARAAGAEVAGPDPDQSELLGESAVPLAIKKRAS